MSNEFAKILQGTLIPDRVLQPSIQVLEEFCQGVEEATGDAVQCNLTEGFLSELGQEWRVIARPGKAGAEFVLLRAHIPANGFPVYLDYYDKDMLPCTNVEKLRKALQEFLRLKMTKENLSLLFQHSRAAAQRRRTRRAPTSK